MKLTTKIFIVTLVLLFLTAVAVESKAGRGGDYRGKYYSRHGHFKYGHKGYYGFKNQGHRRYYSPGKHYFRHGHRPYYRHSHRYGILYDRGLYGYYSYGKYRYHRYPYQYRYDKRSYRPGGYNHGEYLGPKTLRDYDEEFAQGWYLLKQLDSEKF